MRNFYSFLFLLSGILFGLTSCTKETQTIQPPAVLSAPEATALLAKSIQSTEDDVIYLDMTFEQAQKMGITDKLYRDALAQIDALNQSIRESKEKGITVVNGLKKSNKMPETKWSHNPDNPNDPDSFTVVTDLLNLNRENKISLECNPDIYGTAICHVCTYPTIDPEPDFLNPNRLFFDVTVRCINSNQTAQLVGMGYDPFPHFNFNSGLYAERYISWEFTAQVNSSSYKQIGLSFYLTKSQPQ